MLSVDKHEHSSITSEMTSSEAAINDNNQDAP